MKGNSEEARSINRHLDMIKIKIIDAQMELLHKNLPIRIGSLKSKIFDINLNKRILIPIFQDHNNKIKELVGKEYASGTLERYTTSLKHTLEFLEWKYKVSRTATASGFNRTLEATCSALFSNFYNNQIIE